VILQTALTRRARYRDALAARLRLEAAPTPPRRLRVVNGTGLAGPKAGFYSKTIVHAEHTFFQTFPQN